MNTLCFSTNLSSSELAAWVQAYGSIAAVLVAVFLMYWQIRQNKRLTADIAQRSEQLTRDIEQRSEQLRKDADRRKLEAIRAVVLHTAFGVKGTVDAISSATADNLCDILKTHAGLMTDVNRPIQAILLHELPSSDLVNCIFGIDTLGRRVAANIESIQRSIEHGTLNLDDVKTAMEHQSTTFAERKNKFQDTVDAVIKALY